MQPWPIKGLLMLLVSGTESLHGFWLYWGGGGGSVLAPHFSWAEILGSCFITSLWYLPGSNTHMDCFFLVPPPCSGTWGYSFLVFKLGHRFLKFHYLVNLFHLRVTFICWTGCVNSHTMLPHMRKFYRQKAWALVRHCMLYNRHNERHCQTPNWRIPWSFRQLEVCPHCTLTDLPLSSSDKSLIIPKFDLNYFWITYMPVPLLIHVNEENRGGWVQVRFDNIKWKKKKEKMKM